MKKKVKKNKKTDLTNVITFRVNEVDFSKLKAMSKMYADGVMSQWLRHCIAQYQPKMVQKKRPRVSPRP